MANPVQLSSRDLAARYGVAASTIRRWTRTGVLPPPSVSDGGARWDASEILDNETCHKKLSIRLPRQDALGAIITLGRCRSAGVKFIVNGDRIDLCASRKPPYKLLADIYKHKALLAFYVKEGLADRFRL